MLAKPSPIDHKIHKGDPVLLSKNRLFNQLISTNGKKHPFVEMSLLYFSI